MQLFFIMLILSISVHASGEWPYYQVQKGDSLESISLSLYGSAGALKKTTPMKALPPVGKHFSLPPKLLRLKCNIGEIPRFMKLNYQLKQVTVVYAKRSFHDPKKLRDFIRANSECLSDLKPWRKLQFISYAVAVDDIEEKNDDISTQTRVSSFAGLEYFYRREFGWSSPWVVQLRGRLLKGNSAKGFSLGPQMDLEAALGKEIQKNSQVIYAKLWQNQFDFVGNDPDDYVSPYTVGSTYFGLAYEYIYLRHNRPWFAELGAYYQMLGSFTPEVNSSKTEIGGFALRGSLKIPFEIADLDNFFVQPSWQYMNLTGKDYGLFINQFVLAAGMKF